MNMEKLLKWYNGLDATKKKVLILTSILIFLIIVCIILPKPNKKESYVKENISNSNASIIRIEKTDNSETEKDLNKEKAMVVSKGEDEDIAAEVIVINSLSVKPKEEKFVESKREEKITVNLNGYGRSDPYKPLVKKLVEESPQPIEGIPLLPFPTDIKPPPLPQEMERKDFTLTGILWDEEPLAIIEGEGLNAVVKEGDYVKDYVVDKIERKKVILKKGNKKIVLRIGG